MSGYKLNHIALNVKDPKESAKFYTNLLKTLGLEPKTNPVGGNIIVYLDDLTSIGLKKSDKFGSREGVDHFGFTSANKNSLDTVADKLRRDGLSIESKEHRDKSESIFLKDSDGYMIQIVYMPEEIYR